MPSYPLSATVYKRVFAAPVISTPQPNLLPQRHLAHDRRRFSALPAAPRTAAQIIYNNRDERQWVFRSIPTLMVHMKCSWHMVSPILYPI